MSDKKIKKEVKIEIETEAESEGEDYESILEEGEEDEEEEDDEDANLGAPNQGNPPVGPGIPNLPPLVAMANDITGSQLAALRNYSGNDGDDIELWCNHVGRIQTAFGWAGPKTGQIAQNKLTEKAANWLEVRKALGEEFADWDSLKKGLIARFKRETSDVTAALAVCDLQQGNTESVADFYDRCVMTMRKKNHRVTDALKQTNDWKLAQQTELFVFFGGGLKRYIRNATICSSNPPETANDLLVAAKRVEMQSEAKDKLFELETEKTDDGNFDETEKEENEWFDRIDEIAEELAALRTYRPFKGRGGKRRFSRGFASSRGFTSPRGNFRGRGWNRPSSSGTPDLTCWICGKKGHISRNCSNRSQLQKRQVNEMEENEWVNFSEQEWEEANPLQEDESEGRQGN